MAGPSQREVEALRRKTIGRLRAELDPVFLQGYELEAPIAARALARYRGRPSRNYTTDLYWAIQMHFRYDQTEPAAKLVESYASMPYEFRAYHQILVASTLAQHPQTLELATRIIPILISTSPFDNNELLHDLFGLQSIYALALWKTGAKRQSVSTLHQALRSVRAQGHGLNALIELLVLVGRYRPLNRRERSGALKVWEHLCGRDTFFDDTHPFKAELKSIIEKASPSKPDA